ncbi:MULTISPECIES: hypothetical protein [unclassified Pseudoalteromonas]|uniref:hypothetical protein n=1 Tax=unclassified Pseudoalteromonas TaxID=194690 RepID=UPI0011099118|nr:MULTISPECIES: hypothetical protein [unclassified Pseudoalteromonas]TMN70556.1 hypothetical protein CWB85_15050 [Pseudoalteromonas sp. S1727]BDF96446.1 hypothetical protein KAN5_32840 [Pseudoalteromonas sp. KAN5]
MQRLILASTVAASLAGCGLQATHSVPAPDYTIEHDQFVSQNEVIPAGCFAQLVTNLNGDNTTAAVFIESANSRGCNSANYPYPGGDETQISYSIEKILPDHNYQLKVCETRDEGSIAAVCDQIVVQFTNLDYQLVGGAEQVLSIIKRGEW